IATREYLHVGELPQRELETIFVRGEPPDLRELIGWEYRGLNTPAFAKLLGIKKFVKGFYADDAGQVFGYNEPIVQNGLDEPWRAKPSGEAPKRFGFFRVMPVDASSRDNAYLNSVLLDYGSGPGTRWDPTRVLRDYVVRIERGSDERLLGKAYV